MSIQVTSFKASVKNGGFKPRIVICGVGGAGNNAINNMIRNGLDGVEFWAVNTDVQTLEYSLADRKIQIGKELTQGLGAGTSPEIGKKAVEENITEIREFLTGTHMLFIAAGMGGGTGTGSAPVIASIAKEMDILTVAVVTKPFDFEGKIRQRIADNGINQLVNNVDTLIVTLNQNLFRIANERTSFAEAFQISDEVMEKGVRSVTDLIISPGLINLDFADVRMIMKNTGRAVMSSGEAVDAINAAQFAIVNPLLDMTSINGARGLIINVTGGPNMSLFDVNDAVNTVRDNVSENCNVVFGAMIDENFKDNIRVSVVATGIEEETDNKNSQIIGKYDDKKEEIVEEKNKTSHDFVSDNRDLYNISSEENDDNQSSDDNTSNNQSDDDDFENIKSMDDYIFKDIKELSSKEATKLAKKHHKSDHKTENVDSSSVASRKNGIGSLIGNIVFGSDNMKKKKREEKAVAFDLFETEVTSYDNVNKQLIK